MGRDYLKLAIEHWDLVVLLIAAVLIWQNYGSENERMVNILLLTLGAFAVEKYYVNRGTVLPNILVIYFIFRGANPLPDVFNYYLLGGLLIGTAMLYFLLQKIELPSWVYGIIYPIYGLKTILAFYVTYLIHGLTFDWVWWGIFVILLAAIWVFGVKRAGNKSPLEL